MKKMFALLVLSLAISLGSSAYAQKLALLVTATGAPVDNGVLELSNEKRMLWIVDDQKPRDAGYAYEIGPLWLVPANGEKVLLKEKQLVNSPAMYYTVRKDQLLQYPQGFDLQLDAVVRYNPDRSHETLPFTSKDLKIKFIPKLN